MSKLRKVALCDATEVNEKIKEMVGEESYSEIIFNENDREPKRWILDILTRETMLSARSQLLVSAYVLLLTAFVLFFMVISPDGILNFTKTFFGSITGAIKSLSFDIGKILVLLSYVVAFLVLFFFMLLLIATAISNALMLFVYRKQIASPKDLETLFENMDKRWHAIFIEWYATPFLKEFHLFNDIRVIIEEEIQPLTPTT